MAQAEEKYNITKNSYSIINSLVKEQNTITHSPIINDFNTHDDNHLSESLHNTHEPAGAQNIYLRNIGSKNRAEATAFDHRTPESSNNATAQKRNKAMEVDELGALLEIINAIIEIPDLLNPLKQALSESKDVKQATKKTELTSKPNLYESDPLISQAAVNSPQMRPGGALKKDDEENNYNYSPNCI